MAIDFPATPTNGQEFTSAGITYVYNGVGWTIKGGSASSFVLKAGDTMTGVLAISNTTASTTPTTGALTIAGGLGVSGQIFAGSRVNGNDLMTTRLANGGEIFLGTSGANFLQHDGTKYSFGNSSPVYIPNTTASTNATTGALTIAGGVGIGGVTWTNDSIVVGGDIHARAKTDPTAGYLYLGNSGSRYLNYSTNNAFNLIGAPLKIADGTASTSSTTGALTVAGGLGVGGNVNIAGGAATTAILKVGHGSANWGMALRPSADPGFHITFENAAGTGVGSITTTTSATAFSTSSDARLKEDLKSFDAGHIVDNTNVYDFKWKTTGERSYGVVAQQANEIYPTAVTHDEKQDWWGIDYSKYVPVLLQELKALRTRVAELNTRVAELEVANKQRKVQ